MGNDGGTIVKRLDIVKLRNDGSDAKVDPAILAKVRATTCSLSHQPLRIPIVADRIGNLYNKDSILKYLISKSDSQGESDVGKKADRIAGHIRGLKDVQTLKPTENPACKNSTKKSEQDEDKPAPFICPLNQREMNGRHRFIYIRQCGCMMSSFGLIATISDQLANNSKEQREGTDQIENTVCCPICATNFSANCFRKNEIIPGMDVIILNGSETEVQAQRISMENDRAAEQARKKEAKAKKNEITDLDKKQRKEEKRKRKEEAVTEVDQDVKRIRHADQKPPNKSDLVAH